MSGTSQTVVDNVRRILRDPEPDPVIPKDTIKYHIDACVPEVADSCSLVRALSATLVTLVAGTHTYTLSASEYDYLDQLYYASDKVELERTSLEKLRALRQGSSGSTGRPTHYALEPQSDQTLDLVFYPTPVAGEVVSGYVSPLPAAWGTTATTAPTIPFSQRALRALELKVAASVIAGMNAEVLTALRIDKQNGALAWERRADELLRRERLVVSRLRSQHGPTNHRWLASWRRS